MKIQDIGCIIVVLLLLLLGKKKLFVIVGLICYLFAIPLFYRWIFFTAERLTWYGSLFIFISLLIPKCPRGTVK